MSTPSRRAEQRGGGFAAANPGYAAQGTGQETRAGHARPAQARGTDSITKSEVSTAPGDCQPPTCKDRSRREAAGCQPR